MCPTGILLLCRIDSVPTTLTYRQELAIIRQMCGDEFLKNVILVATFGSNSEQQELWIQQLLNGSMYWRPFLLHDAQKARFDGTYESASAIMRKLARNAPIPLLIQRELIEKRLSIEQTAAWKLVRNPEDSTQREATTHSWGTGFRQTFSSTTKDWKKSVPWLYPDNGSSASSSAQRVSR